MIISHRHRFIFIHILKTGGEAVTAALEPVLGPQDIVLKSEADMWLRSLLRSDYRHLDGLRKHSMARTVRAKLPPEIWQDYLRFSFVRHPVDRAVSLYRYVGGIVERRMRPSPRHLWYRLTEHGRRADPLLWKSTQAFRETASFSEFIRHPALENAQSLRSQADYLSSGKGELLVDVVGHVESLRRPARPHRPARHRGPTAAEAERLHLAAGVRAGAGDRRRPGVPARPVRRRPAAVRVRAARTALTRTGHCPLFTHLQTATPPTVVTWPLARVAPSSEIEQVSEPPPPLL